MELPKIPIEMQKSRFRERAEPFKNLGWKRGIHFVEHFAGFFELLCQFLHGIYALLGGADGVFRNGHSTGHSIGVGKLSLIHI